MKIRTALIALALLLCLMALPAGAEPDGCSITLPAGYETSGRNYPVVYVLPQDGFAADESGIADQLAANMASGLATDMIIVRPAFAEGDDLYAVMEALVAQVDSEYRTIADAQHRTVAGTGVGGYLAYVLGLSDAQGSLAAPKLFGAIASIRGDFSSEANPWKTVYGDVYARMNQMHLANNAVFDGFYTYMDAPVEDAFTNMEGSTNDMGALFIGYGTGSAAHEFTVRPGSFDDAFLGESVLRLGSRLTARMLGSIASGKISLEKTTLTENDAEATMHYTLTVSDAIAAFAPEGTSAQITISIADPATGETLTSTTIEQLVTGAGAIEGSAVLPNLVNGTSSSVKLSVSLLGTDLDLASCTLIRSTDPVVDGDIQKVELLGDWRFNYVGQKTVIDVAALTKEETETWSIVQPTLGNWTNGYGNISDQNVTSMYGPDYFDYFIVGAGYYAKTFTVPENFDAKELVLSIGYVDDRCEVFLNGTRVGATGMDENGQPTGETTWAVYSKFDVDPALVNVGGENTVVVRAWNDVPLGAGGWYGGPVGLYSAAAFAEMNPDGASERFFEASFPSAHAAAALGQEGTVDNKYLIYLPEGYFTSDRRYPTVYLLHQFNSDHTSYKTDAVDQLFDAGIAAGLFDEMIVVIPNSDPNSWWAGEWEKMVTDELIPLIDNTYRTIRDARYRLTAGCSMGGQGSMAVALRNPDFFSGAVSFYGAFSYGGASSPNAIAASESTEYMDNFSLYFICGNQDSYGFGAPAIELNQLLEEKGVNHRFFIDNGGHDSGFYVPFFGDAFGYIRQDMYKSDEAAQALLTGSLTVDDYTITAQFKADAAISAYMNAIPASFYTKNPAPALSIPLRVELVQDGVVVHAFEANDVEITSDDLEKALTFDMTGKIDTCLPVTVVLKAQLFDRVVTLATAE